MGLSQLRGGPLLVAVVGITSSGKSAFLNALLGETLLPEQCQPTTNCRTLIRRGPQRLVRVKFMNSSELVLAGEEVNAERIIEYASEERNPENSKHVELIEVESPNSLFDDGYEFLDTPGLDAYGHDWHQTLTLEEIVPHADLVIYMVSVRNAIHRVDVRALGRLMEHDQRVLFVISGKDLERDDTEVGRIISKRETKLERQLQRLRSDAGKCQGLRTAGFALVDSKLAQRYHRDRHSPEWAWCGFDDALNLLSGLGATVQATARDGRIGRAGRHVRVALGLVDEQLARVDGDNSTTRMESIQRKRRISELESALGRSETELSLIEDPRSWDPPSEASTDDLTPASSRTQLEGRVKALDRWLAEGAKTLRSRLAKLADVLAEEVHSVNLEAPRQLVDECVLDQLPAAELATITRKETRVERVGWGWRLPPWPHKKQSEVTVREHDIPAFRSQLATRAKTAIERLSHYRDVTVRGLRRRYLSVLENERDRLNEEDAAQRRPISATANELMVARDTLERLCAQLREATPLPEVMLPDVGTATRPISGRTPRGPARVLAPVLMAFRELGLPRLVLTMVDDAVAAASVEPSGPLAIGIAGLSAEDRWRFVNLLLHRISAPLRPAVSGAFTLVSSPSAQSAASVDQLTVTAKLVERCSLMVTADDENEAWANGGLSLFEKCTCKFVLIDGSKIGHALSRLIEAPYHRLLEGPGPQVVYVVPHGAAFDQYLERLALVIRPSLQRKALGTHRILVHEGYDVRYTHLLELAGRMGPAEGRRYWTKRLRLPTTNPFDLATIEDVLEQCYRENEQR